MKKAALAEQMPNLSGHQTQPAAGLPQIGIAVPNRNGGAFLADALESLVTQEYPHLTIFVMDGGSTDRSVEIIRRYEETIEYWRSDRDDGQAAAIDDAFRLCNADVIGWLNSDDVLLPGALERVGRYFAAHPDAAVVTGLGECVRSLDGPVLEVLGKRERWTFEDLLRYDDGLYLPQPAVFFRRAAYERVGGLNRALQFAMDVDLFLRLAVAAPIEVIAEPIARLRWHDETKTSARRVEFLEEVSGVVRAHARRLGVQAERAARNGMRRRIADADADDALRAAVRGEWSRALRRAVSAMTRNPRLAADRRLLSVLGRVVVPGSLQKALFRNPSRRSGPTTRASDVVE